MSADKFPWIFSRQMDAIVYIAVTEKYGRRVLKRILKLQYGLRQLSARKFFKRMPYLTSGVLLAVLSPVF